MSTASRAGQGILPPAPAPAPSAQSPASLPPNSFYFPNTATFQPTRVFTLAFFAIALVACIVLTMFITLTLVRRRRARLQYLSRSRMSTVTHPRRSVARSSQTVEAEPPRVIPPLIEGVLVMHPNGEEQVAYPSDKAKLDMVPFDIDTEGSSDARPQSLRQNDSPV